MRTMSAGEARRALASLESDTRTSSPSGLLGWLRRLVLAAIILALMILLWGTAMGWFSTPAQVIEVRATINQQIAELDKIGKGELPYDGGPNMGKVFGSMRDLPEGMRNQVRRDIGRLMQANDRAEVNSFFQVPPAQRQAELDRRIKAEDDRRKQFMADRGKRGADRGQQPDRNGGQQGQAGGGGGGPGGGGPGGPGGGRGPGGGGGPRGGGSEEDRNNRRKSMLDNTDPVQRTRRTEYRRQMDERRQQTGAGGGGGRR